MPRRKPRHANPTPVRAHIGDATVPARAAARIRLLAGLDPATWEHTIHVVKQRVLDPEPDTYPGTPAQTWVLSRRPGKPENP